MTELTSQTQSVARDTAVVVSVRGVWGEACGKGLVETLHVQLKVKVAPLTILDSGALQVQPRKWQLTGIDCSTAAQASGCPEPVLTDYWTHSMQPAGILHPINARPSLHCALSLAAQCIVIGPVCGRVYNGRAVSKPYYSQRAVFDSL